MLRPVHVSKVVKAGNEYNNPETEGANDSEGRDQHRDETRDTDNITNAQSLKVNAPVAIIGEIEKKNANPLNSQAADKVSEVDKTPLENENVKKRYSPLRCPDKNRTIVFKRIGDDEWKRGEVVEIKTIKGTNRLECDILLDSDDIVVVYIASGNYEWKYISLSFDICTYRFYT